MTRRAVIVTPSLGENSLGRTMVTWTLLSELGWEVSVVAPGDADIWQPVVGTEFASACQGLGSLDGAGRADALADLAARSDVVIATKALPESFGLLAPIVDATGRRMILDYDDPDQEVWSPYSVPLWRVSARWGRHPLIALKMARVARWRHRLNGRIEYIVSNPQLQRSHGGTIVPHARTIGARGADHTSEKPTVAFIGTARQHKGIDEVRDAVAGFGPERFKLVVTDEAPPDARDNEDWVGRLPFEAAMELLRSSDIAVIPSKSTPFTHGQLPAKLIDGMMAGRLVIASDLPPIRWALGDAGILFDAGNRQALSAALERGADPATRRVLGDRARESAIERFSIDACLPAMKAVVERVTGA